MQRDSARGKLTRYADDAVIVCRTRVAAERALQAVIPVLARRKRTLPPTKTRIVERQQAGCEFRGFHVQKGRARRRGQWVPLMWPGQKAMQAGRGRIRVGTERRGLRGAMAARVAKLNPIIRGGRHDFCIGNSTTQFQALDRDVRQRVVAWECARRKGHLAVAQLQALLRARGIGYFDLPGRGGTCPGTPQADGCRQAVGGGTARTVCGGRGWKP